MCPTKKYPAALSDIQNPDEFQVGQKKDISRSAEMQRPRIEKTAIQRADGISCASQSCAQHGVIFYISKRTSHDVKGRNHDGTNS
jgi:hypothetical protein